MKRKRKRAGMRVPGKIFEKHVKYGDPEINGVYLCYYKPNPPHATSAIFPMAGMKVGTWSEGKWGIQEMVLAWIGPLPTVTLDELELEEECCSRVFCIGTLKQAAKGTFVKGPFAQHILATLKDGKKGQFIFEVNTHKTLPNPTARYSPKINRWKFIKNKKKYFKIMKKY